MRILSARDPRISSAPTDASTRPLPTNANERLDPDEEAEIEARIRIDPELLEAESDLLRCVAGEGFGSYESLEELADAARKARIRSEDSASTDPEGQGGDAVVQTAADDALSAAYTHCRVEYNQVVLAR